MTEYYTLMVMLSLVGRDIDLQFHHGPTTHEHSSIKHDCPYHCQTTGYSSRVRSLDWREKTCAYAVCAFVITNSFYTSWGIHLVHRLISECEAQVPLLLLESEHWASDEAGMVSRLLPLAAIYHNFTRVHVEYARAFLRQLLSVDLKTWSFKKKTRKCALF